MHNIYKNFYKSFYLKTGGFIPTSPANMNVYPGDFFQIKQGEIILLGNIFRDEIIDPQDIEWRYDVDQNPNNWNFHHGVSKPFSGKNSGNDVIDKNIEHHRQVLAFNDFGSFIFKGVNPKSFKVVNWNDIQHELIIKLTTTLFSFREVYVVTESAITDSYTLAVASSKKAELEITSNSDKSGITDLFGLPDSKTVHAKDLEYYYHEEKKKTSFFKAKRLAVQNEKLDVFINDLIIKKDIHNQWASDFFDYNIHYDQESYVNPISRNAQLSMLDMLQANELNPNTALLYFKWEDTNLNDIEKLFITYGI